MKNVLTEHLSKGEATSIKINGGKNDNYTEIAHDAFECYTGLKEVVVPEGIETIGAFAFAGCCNLTKVSLPSTLKEIDVDAFADCRLVAVEIPDGVKEIGGRAFADDEIEKLFIPPSVEKIGDTVVFGPTSGSPAQTTIYGVAGSEAEKFAKEKGIPFSTDTPVEFLPTFTGKVFVSGHVNPDKDSEYSEEAIKILMEGRAEIVYDPKDADLIVLVDGGREDRFFAFHEFVGKQMVVIDHHSELTIQAHDVFVDPSAPSCTWIIWSLFKDHYVLNKDPDRKKKFAGACMVGLLSDTNMGQFVAPVKRVEYFRVLAEMVEAGADYDNINTELTKISHKKWEIQAAGYAAFKDAVVNYNPIAIGEVDCNLKGADDALLVLSKLQNPPRIQLEILPKGEDGKHPVVWISTDDTDVSQVAKQFGGGGHIHCAGASVAPDKLEEVKAVTKSL